MSQYYNSNYYKSNYYSSYYYSVTVTIEKVKSGGSNLLESPITNYKVVLTVQRKGLLWNKTILVVPNKRVAITARFLGSVAANLIKVSANFILAIKKKVKLRIKRK